MAGVVGGCTACDCCSVNRNSQQAREPDVRYWLGSGSAGSSSHDERRAYGLCGGASPGGSQAAWNSPSLGTPSREFRTRVAEQGGGLVAHDDDYRGPQEIPPPD